MYKKIKRLIKKTLYFILVNIHVVISKFRKNKYTEEVLFLIGFTNWKRPYINILLQNYNIRYLHKYLYNSKFLFRELDLYINKKLVIWGYSEPQGIREYAEKNNIPIWRIEDGFLRSVGLGAEKKPPYSLCLDKLGLYYDATRPSELENILMNYDFSSDEYLLKRSRDCMLKVLSKDISKYNFKREEKKLVYPANKKSRRVLVIGQVEDDASIKKGCAIPITNNDLVKIAVKENPEAEVYYKPHPDVVLNKRRNFSDPNEVKDIVTIIDAPISLPESLETIDHVYTITSLGGFEALLRGIKVTTFGAPFYSGWGLTDDRQPVTRRTRDLLVEELFAGAYILYPKYINPYLGEIIEIEEVIDLLVKELYN